MTRNSKTHRRLNIERLELRELLCGSTVASSILSSAAQSALFAKAHTTTTATTNTSKSTSGGDQSAETFLVTTLTNSSGEVVGTATYETETDGSTTKQTLIISVVGAAASASYTVSVGDTNLGTLTTDANGNGKLILTSSGSTTGTTSSATKASSNCSGGNTTTGTLPDGFTLAAGAAISLASTDTTVDQLSGTFATSTGPIGEGNGNNFGNGNHGGCNGNGNSSSVSRTIAALADSATGDSVGKAVFTTITHADGTTAEILRIHVTGTDVSSTFDVTVDGTSVGTITTDANGNGSLILSSNPKTSNVGQLPSGITSPTNITISNATTGTTITGTFSSSSSSSATGSFASASRFFSRRR